MPVSQSILPASMHNVMRCEDVDDVSAVNTALQQDAVNGEANLTRRHSRKPRNRQAMSGLLVGMPEQAVVNWLQPATSRR